MGRGLSYALHRTRRRTISIEVHPHGELIVRSPMRLPLHEIEAFLRSRKVWIADRLAEARDARSIIPPLPSPNHVYHRGVALLWEDSEQALARWQRKEATNLFEGIIADMLPRLGVASLRYQQVRTRKMRRRWGSCSADGRITLNEYLIRLPDVCTEAVIAHELAHLVHMDHSRAFNDLARQIMPGYDQANTILDGWTALLNDLAPTTNNGAKSPVEHRIIWLDA